MCLAPLTHPPPPCPTPHNNQPHMQLAARIDPFDDYYRVRMVCTLLDTCGTYFSEGRAAAKLDRFLMFFQVRGMGLEGKFWVGKGVKAGTLACW